jgi:pimeloyl-ACP methyl ester carboxylesterase
MAPEADLHCDTAHGRGPLHVVCLPGLVPDGPETFARQEALLRSVGGRTVVTYPYRRFDLDRVLHSVEHRIRAAHDRGHLPVLLGVSVGGGLCLELVRRTRDAGRPLPLHGLILASPLTSTNDLAPLLRRILDPIERATDEAGRAAAVERGRAFFRTLATRAAGVPAEAAQGLPALFKSWLPGARWERRLLERIERTLSSLPAAGAIERVLALKQLAGVTRGKQQPLTTAPTLLLWGSRERHTLDMDGPGTGVLCRPDLACQVLPGCEVHWVYQADGGDVPHASLIKHAAAFNPHLKRFLHRLMRRRSTAAAA